MITLRWYSRSHWIVLALSPLLFWGSVLAQEGPEVPQKPVAGKADVLRHVEKHFARITRIDLEASRVELQIDGQDTPKEWPIQDDANLMFHGWWGRLSQYKADQRVWVWFDVDRKKRPIAVLMMADEISEREIHSKANENELAPLRQQQRDYLREIWRDAGLPGAVGILHKLAGEMEVLLDHESMRWGRCLAYRDQVTLVPATENARPIQGVVHQVRPWREKTVVRLVTDSGLDQADLKPGQRIHLKVPEPPQEVQRAIYPTDVGRERSRGDRIEWFLCSIYCTCAIAGDRCTGMFYTLASCDRNGCGMPDAMRKSLGDLIDEGKADEEILDELLEKHGPALLRPHLLK